MRLVTVGIALNFLLGALLVWIGASVHRFSAFGREALMVAGFSMLCFSVTRVAYTLEQLTSDQQREINALITIGTIAILSQIILLFRIQKRCARKKGQAEQ